MKLLGSVVAVVLLSSVVFSFVPPHVFVEKFEPEVSCLSTKFQGMMLVNNCSYSFHVMSNGREIGVIPENSTVPTSLAELWRCSPNDCYLEGGGQRIKLTLVMQGVHESTVGWNEKFFMGLLYSSAAALVLGLLMVFNFLKKKKNGYLVKGLFLLFILLAIFLFFMYAFPG